MDKTVLQKTANMEGRSAEGVRFVFERDCHAASCRTYVKTPLAAGGFDKDRLYRVSGRLWRTRRSTDRQLCYQPDGSKAYTGTSSEQYTVRITATETAGAVAYAIRADVYYRTSARCAGAKPGRLVALYRGSRDTLPR
jgi:hypothetical protein